MSTDALDGDRLAEMLRMMKVIRRFEDRVFDLFAEGKIAGSTHLCQGQEAVAVGGCFALDERDLMVCTYRGHGQSLAKGIDVRAAAAEVLGRATGCCGGKGGSMHFTDVARGAMGSFAIVGAGLPVATGLAWAAAHRGTGQVVACFFGDGSTNIGAFHEALNLASVWGLPVVFICENNLYGEYSPISVTTPMEDLVVRADAYGIASRIVDGNDVEAVYQAVSAAAEQARTGGGPSFLEAKTYRQKGHSRGDPATYRPPGELERWLAKDPIDLLVRRMEIQGLLDKDQAAGIDDQARTVVEEAFELALSDPEPDPSAMFEDVFAEEIGVGHG